MKRWAAADSVPLRIAAHCGQVCTLLGADGREQAVGDAINEAGALLELISDAGVVASWQFWERVEAHGLRDVSFHDDRTLLLGGSVAHRVGLLSAGPVDSRWQRQAEDRVSMRTAALAGDAWEALYHAMRVLQLSSSDADVNQVLRQLRSEDFRSPDGRAINPLFGYLGPRVLREVIRSGQLIERSASQVVCRYGDEGDTMFVVLRGVVGVYNADATQGRGPAGPAFITARATSSES